MRTEKWLELIATEGFWGGVLASILAGVILIIITFIFKNALRAALEKHRKGRREDELFESALNISSPYAPFAFGAAQGRALRYFLIAVFFSIIGSISEVIWPFSTVFYVISLVFILVGLKWFYRIEKRALQILNSASDPSNKRV